MTVRELIERLQELDPELRVYMCGYEGGYGDVSGITDPSEFALNVHEEWYYGPHENADRKHYVKDKSEYTIMKGVVLFSKT